MTWASSSMGAVRLLVMAQTGDGKGLAAAYVFPKPRDFQAGRFRLVSTSNTVPSRDDLHAVLLRGNAWFLDASVGASFAGTSAMRWSMK